MNRPPWYAGLLPAAIGLAIAAALAALMLVAGSTPTLEWFTWVAAGVLPPAVAVGWWLVTRRRTEAEHDVERSWDRRASAGAFKDMILGVAVAVAVAAIVVDVVDPELELPVVTVLIPVLSGGAIAVTIRHLVIRSREA